ncbi:Hypothetical protein CINCED_3A011315 [Cinara cedri]|uniref:Uncharacterized protein n=1 Tax=Cinara cedri TaxID=506608 RepID=A0A5E4MMP9_9HEMI|nr:Hypothetical protein CINCED_3A011315 [Cinara cedri]
MRPVEILFLSVFWVGGSRAASISDGVGDAPSMENPSDTGRGPGDLHIPTTTVRPDLTVAGVQDAFERLAKRLYADETIGSFWTPDGYDDDSNGIGDRKISKKKPWDVYTLMLGAAAKLILFLPILAVLTGKAISLSLTSLLITSLAFLYRAQSDSFVKRSDSKESLLANSHFMR